ncbi:Glucosamine-6-Phosphate Isomerase 1 [Manis pentadactyla]|nr:Glucosamine-6-Phosphate Isomerase 1 [Manis pentadactyla]
MKSITGGFYMMWLLKTQEPPTLLLCNGEAEMEIQTYVPPLQGVNRTKGESSQALKLPTL